MTLEEAIALIEILKAEKAALAADKELSMVEREKLLGKRDELLGQVRKLKDVDVFLKTEGLDLPQLRDRLEEIETLKSGDAKQIEEKYRSQYNSEQKALEKMRAEMDQRLQAMEKERAEEKAKAIAAKLNQDVLSEASKQTYQLFNPQQFLLLFGGKVTRDEETDELIIEEGYKKTPLGTYIESLKDNPDYQNLFKSNGMSGGGTQQPDGVMAGAENPWKTGNMTDQMKLYKKDPARARILAQQCGVTLPS